MFYLLFPITNDEEITTELDAASLHVLEDWRRGEDSAIVAVTLSGAG